MRNILFLFVILLTTKLGAQIANFTISPSQSICINSVNNNPTVTIINSSSTIATYSWVLVNSICVPGTVVATVPNGSVATLYFPPNCCGFYSITCSAFDNFNNLQASYTRTYIVICAPYTSIASTNTTSSNPTICFGTITTLTATGANTYSWSGPGVQNFTNTNVSVSPTTSSCYSVIGTNTFGCFSTSSVCITVQPLPTITISGNTTVCVGSIASFSCSGANTYTWSTGSNNSVISVTPSSNSTYTVTGKDSSGCINSKQVQVVLSSCLGLENTVKITELVSFYPNPVKEKLYIQFKEVQQYSWRLIINNSLGEEVYSILTSNQKQEIDLNFLASGIYTCILTNDLSRSTFKLIKTE